MVKLRIAIVVMSVCFFILSPSQAASNYMNNFDQALSASSQTASLQSYTIEELAALLEYDVQNENNQSASGAKIVDVSTNKKVGGGKPCPFTYEKFFRGTLPEDNLSSEDDEIFSEDEKTWGIGNSSSFESYQKWLNDSLVKIKDGVSQYKENVIEKKIKIRRLIRVRYDYTKYEDESPERNIVIVNRSNKPAIVSFGMNSKGRITGHDFINSGESVLLKNAGGMLYGGKGVDLSRAYQKTLILESKKRKGFFLIMQGLQPYTRKLGGNV